MKTVNDLVVMFPAYAGGKFIRNCLYLSKYFAIPDSTFDLSKADDYQYRLDFVSRSLPPKDQMQNWLKFEFGIHLPAEHQQAKELGLKCAFPSHGFDASILSKRSPCDILKLINYKKFRILAHSLKKTDRPFIDEDSEERYNLIKGDEWPEFEIMESVGFDTRRLDTIIGGIKDEIEKFYPLGSTDYYTHLYDQSSIFDKETFLEEMKKTYIAFNLDDFNESLTSIFYTKYAILHNIRS